jgi:hypothetical protein
MAATASSTQHIEELASNLINALDSSLSPQTDVRKQAERYISEVRAMSVMIINM